MLSKPWTLRPRLHAVPCSLNPGPCTPAVCSAMLAEALHSIADVLNQVLLRVGVMKARRGPTQMHPYGYFR